MISGKFTIPANPKYKHNLSLSVEWPDEVVHENTRYFFHQKEGIRIKDGCPTACYSHITEEIDKRVWLGLDGVIHKD